MGLMNGVGEVAKDAILEAQVTAVLQEYDRGSFKPVDPDTGGWHFWKPKKPERQTAVMKVERLDGTPWYIIVIIGIGVAW